jgi:hypothetical protein
MISWAFVTLAAVGHCAGRHRPGASCRDRNFWTLRRRSRSARLGGSMLSPYRPEALLQLKHAVAGFSHRLHRPPSYRSLRNITQFGEALRFTIPVLVAHFPRVAPLGAPTAQGRAVPFIISPRYPPNLHKDSLAVEAPYRVDMPVLPATVFRRFARPVRIVTVKTSSERLLTLVFHPSRRKTGRPFRARGIANERNSENDQINCFRNTTMSSPAA